jgi:PAS domain S-box-containing protein
MQKQADADISELRFRFSILYVGDCDRHYRKLSDALKLSRRLHFNVSRLATTQIADSLDTNADEAWIIDATDKVDWARRLVDETGGRSEIPPRIVLIRGNGGVDLFGDAMLDADQLDTETVEQAVARALRQRREHRASLERKALAQLQPAPADGQFSIDAQGIIDSATPATEKLLGFPPNGLCGLAASELAPGMEMFYADDFPSADHGPLASRRGRDIWVRRSDGTAIPVNLVLYRHDVQDGQPRTVAMLNDLRMTKENERQLRQSRRFLQAALNSLSKRIAILDDRGVIIAVNDAWRTFADTQADWRSSAVVGANYLDACARNVADCGREGAKVAEGARQILIGERPEYQLQYPFSEGYNTRWFVVRATRFADESHAFLVVAHEEVTERIHLQTQLLQAQKLESIGQLAAGIAHEINTPTQYVGDNTRFLQDAFHDLQPILTELKRVQHDPIATRALGPLAELAARADLDYLLDEIPKAVCQSLEGIERVAGIVRAMKEFAHPGTPDKTPIDLNRAIQSTLTVARNEWKYVADLVTDLDENLPPVPCLPGEINQVILNLVVNAAHAIGDMVSEGKMPKGEIRVTTRLAGDFGEIRVSDNGTGIPAEIHRKIFDPFFSTKAVGKGTGQGLAISHAVVEKHGGTITFNTRLGQGTTFIVRLPLHTATEEGELEALAATP